MCAGWTWGGEVSSHYAEDVPLGEVHQQRLAPSPLFSERPLGGQREGAVGHRAELAKPCPTS